MQASSLDRLTCFPAGACLNKTSFATALCRSTCLTDALEAVSDILHACGLAYPITAATVAVAPRVAFPAILLVFLAGGSRPQPTAAAAAATASLGRIAGHAVLRADQPEAASLHLLVSRGRARDAAPVPPPAEVAALVLRALEVAAGAGRVAAVPAVLRAAATAARAAVGGCAKARAAPARAGFRFARPGLGCGCSEMGDQDARKRAKGTQASAEYTAREQRSSRKAWRAPAASLLDERTRVCGR